MDKTLLRHKAAIRCLQVVGLACYLPFLFMTRHKRAVMLIRLGEHCSPLKRWMIDHFTHLAPLADDREQISYEIMAIATRLGVEFDPPLIHQHHAALDAALTSGEGVLIIGVHASLNYLAVRHLDDRGVDPQVVATYTDRRIFGRRRLPRYINIAPATLLKVRRELTRKGVVIGLIDRGDAARNATAVHIGAARFYVSNGLPRTAVATGARILFMHPILTAAGVEFAWGAPPAHATIDEVMDGFFTFLKEQAARKARVGKICAPKRRPT